MKLKRFALKGLIILVAVLALCAFFSGTVRTITTPKVRLTSGKMGKLEEKTPITASVVFPKTEEVSVPLDEGVTLTILRVNTRAGYTVSEGEVLVEAEIAGYGDKIASLRADYESAESALNTLERKNAGIRVRQQDIDYVSALTGYRAARSAVMLARIDMDTLLNREGLSLGENGETPDKASEKCAAAVEAWREAVSAQESAKAAYAKVERYSIDEDVLTYLTEKTESEEKMASAEEQMRSLSALNASVAEITAPHDGYVAELKVAQGDSYSGAGPLLLVSAEGVSPVLRSDISSVKRQVSKGATVTMDTRWGGKIESRVNETGVENTGAKYADIDINRDILNEIGSVYTLMQAEQPLTLVYKAKESTCLVPVSAVHGSEGDRYVFVVDRQSNTFGSDTLTVTKMSVRVTAEVDGTASLEDDISWYTLAYMEDRAINDGDTVMEYTK